MPCRFLAGAEPAAANPPDDISAGLHCGLLYSEAAPKRGSCHVDQS